MNRKSLVVIFGVLMLCSPVSAQDRTVSLDTDLHILAGAVASFAAASSVIALSSPNDMVTSASVLAAGVAALTAGIGKEVVDSLGFGTPELRDVGNTLLGGVVGMTAVLFSRATLSSDHTSAGDNLGFTYMAMSAVLFVSLLRSIDSGNG